MIARGLMHLLLGLSMATVAVADGSQAPPRLSVTGVGRAMVPADQFQVNLGVRNSAAELQQAQKDVNKSMTDVLAALRSMGLEAPADFQTSRFDISPQWPRNNPRNQANQPPRKIIGYEVSATILVRTTQKEKAAKIIFSKHDKDGSNAIDYTELLGVLEELGLLKGLKMAKVDFLAQALSCPHAPRAKSRLERLGC